MLTELLRRVAQGGLHSAAALARELGVTEALLAQMIDDLVGMGYLRPVSGGCGGGCSACSLAGGCTIGGPGGIWMLTGKGMRMTNEKP